LQSILTTDSQSTKHNKQNIKNITALGKKENTSESFTFTNLKLSKALQYKKSNIETKVEKYRNKSKKI